MITNEKQQILMTQRALHDEQGAGLWEFPGGKIEHKETPTAALIREVKEEVDLDVLAYHYLGKIRYQYPHRSVCLFIYHVTQCQGEARCCEHQMNLSWVTLGQIQDYPVLAANQQIVDLLQTNIPHRRLFC